MDGTWINQPTQNILIQTTKELLVHFQSEKLPILSQGLLTLMFKHIILFRFSDALTQPQCLELMADLGKLQQVIPEIIHYEYGINDFDNTHNKGFEYAFVMTFSDKSARQRYQNNHHHQDYISQKLNHYIEDVIVFDFSSE